MKIALEEEKTRDLDGVAICMANDENNVFDDSDGDVE